MTLYTVSKTLPLYWPAKPTASYRKWTKSGQKCKNRPQGTERKRHFRCRGQRNLDLSLPILRSQQCSTILFLLFEALAPTVQEIKSHFWPKSAIFNIREVFVGPYLGSEWNHKNVASYTSYFFTNSVLHMQSLKEKSYGCVFEIST